MLPFTSHSDPGDEQLELPVPVERVCSCGAKTAEDCPYVFVSLSNPTYRGRKKECLRRIDPSNTPWPEGY